MQRADQQRAGLDRRPRLYELRQSAVMYVNAVMIFLKHNASLALCLLDSMSILKNYVFASFLGKCPSLRTVLLPPQITLRPTSKSLLIIGFIKKRSLEIEKKIVKRS